MSDQQDSIYDNQTNEDKKDPQANTQGQDNQNKAQNEDRKSWSTEFLDFQRISLPRNNKVLVRVVANLTHFALNYLTIFSAILLAFIIQSPLLLGIITASILVWTCLLKASTSLQDMQKEVALAMILNILIIVVLQGKQLFVATGVASLVILGHSYLFRSHSENPNNGYSQIESFEDADDHDELQERTLDQTGFEDMEDI